MGSISVDELCVTRVGSVIMLDRLLIKRIFCKCVTFWFNTFQFTITIFGIISIALPLLSVEVTDSTVKLFTWSLMLYLKSFCIPAFKVAEYVYVCNKNSREKRITCDVDKTTFSASKKNSFICTICDRWFYPQREVKIISPLRTLEFIRHSVSCN